MTLLKNISQTADLYGTVWGSQPPDNPGAAWSLAPGGTLGPYSNPTGLPFNWVLLYPQDESHNGSQSPWFRGRIGVKDTAAIDPTAQSVSITHDSLTPEDVNRVKQMFPDDPQVQALTRDALVNASVGFARDGSTATLGTNQPPPSKKGSLPISDCTYAKIMLLVDAIFLAVGFRGLRNAWSNVDRTWIQHIAEVLEPQMTQVDLILMRLANPANSLATKASEVWNVVKLVYTAGLFEAVYKAIMQTLNWWDMVFYAALGLAEVAAAFLTDGAEIIALIAGEIALAGFFASDLAKANTDCSWGYAAA